MPDDTSWFSLTECCRAFNVTRQTFNQTYRPLVQAEDIRNAGKRGVQIRLRGLIDALVAKRLADAEKATPAEDPLLVGAGSDSPNLERYRAAKAGLAELDLELRKHTHANTRELESVLMRFAALVRRANETLQARFGNDASDILNDAITDALRHLRELFPDAPPEGT